jgi:lipopolysaccharide export system permease protein
VLGIFQRMILWELLKVFLLSLVAITGILLMAGIVAEASQHGLGPGQLFEAIPLLIPSTLPYTIPTTTLFACCVVYGRLAGDNEILAIKAAGINLIKVVTPALLLGFVMSGVTMGLYYRIIPYTHYLLRAMVFEDIEEFMYSQLRRSRRLEHSSIPFTIAVREVQDRKLMDTLVIGHDNHGKVNLVAMAHEAELKVDLPRKLLLVHMHFGDFSMNDGSHGYFPDKTFELELPPNFGTDGFARPPRDMSWQEILQRRRDLEAKTDLLDLEIEAADKEVAKMLPGLDKESRERHRKNLNDEKKSVKQQIVHLYVELLMRPAQAIGCLCFILVGCPVGIWFSRSDYLSSFITCFLPIVIIYYPLMMCGTGFAKEGKFEPITLVWGANVLIGLIGLYLFRRLLRN